MSDPGPLSAEQKEALAAAAGSYLVLMRPARLAKVNAWTVGVFGGITVVWGLVSGGSGLIVGVALLAVAWNEMRGVKQLRLLDPEGARILGWNQLALGGVVVLYCLGAIARSRGAPDPAMKEIEDLAGISSDVVAELTTFLYGGVIVVMVLVQSLLARYHFRVRPKIQAFLRDTPAWMVELITGSVR